MINVQILDDEQLYNSLKSYAVNYYDLTHVLTLKDYDRTRVPSQYVIEEIKDEDKPTIDFANNTFSITPMTDTMRCYLEIFTTFSNKFSLNDMEKLYWLLKSDAVYLTGDARKKFTRLTASNKVGDLISSNKRYKSGKSFVSFNEFKDLRLKDVFSDVKAVDTNFKTREITILSNTRNFDKKGKERVELFFQYDNDGIITDKNQLFYSLLDNISNLAKEGKKLDVLIKENGDIIRFLPDGVVIDNPQVFSQSKKSKSVMKIPVSIWRILYYEYLIRK